MNKTVLSLVGYSGSIATVLASASLANPDTAKTTPYPEVMNLTQVPRFNDRGMIPQVRVATNISPRKSAVATATPVKIAPARALARQPLNQTVAKAKPARVVREELVSQNLAQLRLMKKYGIECASCRNLSPTVMVMGYSSTGM
jgi:hypothetical protein